MDFAGNETPAAQPTDQWDLEIKNMLADNSRIALSL